MSDQRDDLLKEIGDALRVDPSPSFAAGVRTRIAKESGHRRGWLMWFGWAGAAAAVAAGIAVFSMSRRVEFAAPGPVSPPVVAKAETPVAPQVETRVVAPVEAAGVTLPEPNAVISTRALRRDARPAAAVVVFPSDERQALDRLLRSLQAGRAFVPPSASAIDPVTGELLPLPPVEIPPLFPDEDGAARNRTGRLPR